MYELHFFLGGWGEKYPSNWLENVIFLSIFCGKLRIMVILNCAKIFSLQF